jgi:hypothetical protein
MRGRLDKSLRSGDRTTSNIMILVVKRGGRHSDAQGAAN